MLRVFVQFLTFTSANETMQAIIEIRSFTVIASLLKLENIVMVRSLFTSSVTDLISQNVVYQDVLFTMEQSLSTRYIGVENSIFMNKSFLMLRPQSNSLIPSITMDIINTTFSGRTFDIRTNAIAFNISVVNSTIDNVVNGLSFEIVNGFDGRIINSKFSNTMTGLRLINMFQERKIILTLNITNTQFTGGDLSSSTEGIVLVTGPATVAITNCSFINNRASALVLTEVQLYLQENVLFYNNHGVSGGAMVMTNSTIWLDRDSQVKFINNTVLQVGGAIWLTQEQYVTNNRYPPCFYQLTFDIFNTSNNQDFLGLITFQDNHAAIGGDNIYGAALQSNCRMTPNGQIESFRVLDRIFQFRNRSLSSISSSPKKVCVCENGKPMCVLNNIGQDFFQPNYNMHNVTVTPGERLLLSVALVGTDFGLITGGVYALDRSGEDVDFLFSPGDNLQRITMLKCTELEYSIHPTGNQTSYEMILGTDSISTAAQRLMFQNPSFLDYYEAVDLYFSSNEIEYILLNSPVFIKLIILPCPLGTILTNDTYKTCQCQPELENFAENCQISNNTAILKRNGTHWIGKAPGSNFTLLTNSLCPLGYCNTGLVDVELDKKDAQCSLNRSGVLCGGCLPDFSLAIGSSRCLPCQNNNGLALLLFFVIAGVVLVLCIKLLDITVAQGSINGLILYANIIWIHQDVYFPTVNEDANQHFSKLYYFLRLFIAWLNLDFGIETCFFQGLDAYGKTWLQFVFPLYLWILAILIIVSCSYSTTATKIFGNNTVSLLSTLFLLSYTKTQRTVVLIIAPAELTQFNPSGTKLTWRLDSNLDYVGNPHVFLFLVGGAAWIILCVPFTLILLCVKPLQKINCCARLSWQSLIDTYTGPLKAKYRYWVGLTLLTRGVLAITASIFIGLNTKVAIDIVLLSCGLLCVIVLKVYSKWILSFLDLVLIFNLVILSVVFLTTNMVETRVVCTCISVAISFLLFVGIVVYHAYLVVHKHLIKKNKQKEKLEKSVSPLSIDMPQTTTWIALREELLESK